MAAKQQCRQRKCECGECGYVIRVTRAWMLKGLPSCPCGGELEPVEGADLALLGRIGPDDMPAREWTIICRENGWDDAILRPQGTTARYGFKAPEFKPVKPMCAYPGCGKWTAAGAERCSEHSHELAAAIPF